MILVGFWDERTISLLSNKVLSCRHMWTFFRADFIGYLLDVLMIVRQSNRMANQLITCQILPINQEETSKWSFQWMPQGSTWRGFHRWMYLKISSIIYNIYMVCIYIYTYILSISYVFATLTFQSQSLHRCMGPKISGPIASHQIWMDFPSYISLHSKEISKGQPCLLVLNAGNFREWSTG